MTRLYQGRQKLAFELWQRNATTVIAHGPVRSGKTSSLLDGFIMWVLVRGGLFLLASPRLELVERTLVPQFKEAVPSMVRRGRPSGYIDINGGADEGGATILCRSGASDEGSISGIRLNGAFLDEVARFPEDWYMQVQQRCSMGGGKVVGTCNPDAPEHWLKRRVIDMADGTDADDGMYNIGGSIEQFRFTIDDNPALDDAEKARIHRTLHGAWLQRNYYGEWVAAEGAVYPSMANAIGKAPDAPPVATWIAGDWGNRDPSHFVRIEEHENGVRYVTREWRWSHGSGGHMTDDEKARALLAHLTVGSDAPIHAIHVDKSALGMISSLLRFTAVPVRSDGQRAVIDGIQQVRAMLELGRLVVDKDRCPETYREMLSYSFDERGASRGITKPSHEFSHAPDAIRYHVSGTLAQEFWDDEW